jgi:hypothetical protein
VLHLLQLDQLLLGLLPILRFDLPHPLGLLGMDQGLGRLESLQLPRRGDDAIDDQQFQHILRRQSQQPGFAKDLEHLLRLPGQDKMLTVEAMGCRVAAGAGFSVGGPRAGGLGGVETIGLDLLL